MKRSYSDSEGDDSFEEKQELNDSCSPNLPTSTGDGEYVRDRKKRRGIIEKRRRDRINNSLTELRRLVPQAVEKQGSAKLEKAEILQMTVDHLKNLQQKGYDHYYNDPHAYAMDYRALGFRECAAEVARYLVSVEGLDLNDPMRIRILSHLQCFANAAAQRNYPTTGVAASNWSPLAYNGQYSSSGYGSTAGYPTNGEFAPPSSFLSASNSSSPIKPSHPSSFVEVDGNKTSSLSGALSSFNGGYPPNNVSYTSYNPPTSSANDYPPNGLSQMSSSSSGSSKPPYRPWGTELAY